jgi:DNA repair protein RadC
MSKRSGTKACDSELSTEATRYTPSSQVHVQSARKRLGGAADVAHELGDIRSADREHFVVLDLDVRHRILARRVVHIGTLTGVEVHPREVFRGAIANGAAFIILGHNHPSGDPSPSRQDIALTQRLREVSEVCGIPILDHLVVATGGFISLAERGLL